MKLPLVEARAACGLLPHLGAALEAA